MGAHANRAFLFWRFCTCDTSKAPAAEAQKHSTTRGGAHAGVVSWRNKWLPLLLIAGASSGSGSVIGAKGASARLPAMTLQGRAPRHTFVPMLRQGGQLLAGMPPAARFGLFGRERPFEGREIDYEQASRWSSREMLAAVCHPLVSPPHATMALRQG